MLKYASILDKTTGMCAVGIGTDTEAYKRLGMTEMDVEQGADGQWYLTGHAPAGPTSAELLERAKASRAVEFDAVMAGVDRALVRPLSDLLAASVTPSTLSDGEAAELSVSQKKFASLRALQIRNRALRADMMAAKTVEEVKKIHPATIDDLTSSADALNMSEESLF